MSHHFELTDEQYRIIKEVAEAEGRTPEDLFLAWVLEEETRYRQKHPAYYETDDWLRHLEVSDERIQRANTQIAEDEFDLSLLQIASFANGESIRGGVSLYENSDSASASLSDTPQSLRLWKRSLLLCPR